MGLTDSRSSDVGEPCTVAIIGAGSMAREHIRAFQDIPSVRVAGIHSRTRPRAEALAAEFGVPVVSDSVDALYDSTKADLVVVAVPELSTRDVMLACFEHPWTVLVEKPAGYDLVDAITIADAARAKGRKAYLAVNRRFLSSTRAVLGELSAADGQRFIQIQDQQDQAAALAAGQPAEVVRNWMYANSIHVVDLFRFFGRGEVTKVDVVRPYDAATPGIVLAYLEFASGDCGIYEGVWNGPGPWAAAITTPGKRFEIRPLEQASVQKRGERVLAKIDPHAWDTTFKPGFRLQAQAAVDAAQGRATDLPTLDDGLVSMRLIQQIFSIDH
jgi:predicted dehydrogenase